MKESFLDECKERVFESLRDMDGMIYRSSDQLVDDVAFNISDDIYYLLCRNY